MTTWNAAIITNGPHSSVVQQNGRLVNKYQRTYWVGTDSATVPAESDVLAALGIDPGSPYENDLNATCRGITSLTQLPTRTPHIAFHATVEWSTDAPTPNEIDTDPSTMRVVWGTRPRIEPRHITEDRNGDPILNSAGSPYDGGIAVNARLGTAIAKRTIAYADYDSEAALADSGKLNSLTYLGAAPGTLQVDIETQERWQGAYHFVDEVYTFYYDPEGHQPRPLDAGFFQLDADGNPVPITVGDLSDPPTTNSTKVPEPEPLKSDGTVVPRSDRPAACHYLDVPYFSEKDFNDFGLI